MNVVITRAGARIEAGDLVAADDDGVVDARHEDVPEVVAKAVTRAANEEAKRARFAAGELGPDMCEMRGSLEKAGLRYVDVLED